MSIDTYINAKGAVLDMAKEVELSTAKYASEIQKERWTDKTLRSISLWTGEFPVYTVTREGGILYIADREHNLILQNPQKNIPKLIKDENFFLNESEMEQIINAPSTLKITMSDLELEKWNGKRAYFEINTQDYTSMNNARKTLMEKIHGVDQDFKRTMNMLSEERGIKVARIYVVTPEEVELQLEQHKAPGLARLSFLHKIHCYSLFCADGVHVEETDRYIRASPLKKQN